MKKAKQEVKKKHSNHRVIVTADDFGACDFIDDGIREGLKNGVISSVSAFINFEPRDKNHPWGKYKGSVAAIKELLKDLKTKEYEKSKNVRIGLHLNFHAGSPVYVSKVDVKKDPGQLYLIDSLLMKEKKKKKKVFKLVKNKVVFKTMDKFNPRKVDKDEFIRELEAQYNKFEKAFGFDPDHLSAHFPVIFMTPELFEQVCILAKEKRKGKKPVPVRNPILVWQNKKRWAKKAKKANEVKEEFMQNLEDTPQEMEKLKEEIMRKNIKTAKVSSAVRKVPLKTKLKNINKLFPVILKPWRKEAIINLQKNEIDFPDYTNMNLWGNGGRTSKIVVTMINSLQPYRPKFYAKDDFKVLSTEIIVHVGKGNLKKAMEKVPRGIDKGYFQKRTEELDSLIASNELIERTLYHYQRGLQLK